MPTKSGPFLHELIGLLVSPGDPVRYTWSRPAWYKTQPIPTNAHEFHPRGLPTPWHMRVMHRTSRISRVSMHEGMRSAELRQTLPWTTWVPQWPSMPAGNHPWVVSYTSPQQPSHVPPTAPAPARRAASKPLAWPNDASPSVSLNIFQPSAASAVSATSSAAAQSMSSEMNEHTEGASTFERKRKASESEVADEMLKIMYPSQDRPGGMLGTLFFMQRTYGNHRVSPR